MVALSTVVPELSPISEPEALELMTREAILPEVRSRPALEELTVTVL